MTFDLSVTQIYQGVVSGGQNNGPLFPRPGGGSHTWDYGGQGDFVFNLDTGKAGLWQGGIFRLEAEGVWSNNVNSQVGSLMAANTQGIYLSPSDNEIVLSNVSYTQFVSHHLGFFLGKITTITQDSGDMNDFAHGKGDSQFFNLALNFNPTILMVPYSTLGVGTIILPGDKPDDLVITAGAFDPNGNPGTSGLGNLWQDGALYLAEGRLKTNFFGHTGHQLIGGAYSDKLYNSLQQNFRIIIENGQLATTSGAWAVYYNFDQYLYEPSPGRGWGVFGRFGVSDADPSPIEYFWSLGIGGKGMIETRPNDGLGLGFYDAITSDASVPAFLGIGDEWGVEAFYDIALTPWAQLTPDVQYIDGARPNSDPAVAIGFRLKLIF